ncbi:MAG TPA: DnaJ family domain-containing protein [Burkholderiales bacterium]
MEKLIEERIRKAQAEGAFNNLPGEGKPLNLDDDLLIPGELRMVCRVLKNAGYVPPEVEELRELRQLEAVVASDALEGERLAARKRMEFLLIRLEQSGMARVAQAAWDQYAEKVAAKMAETRPRDE